MSNSKWRKPVGEKAPAIDSSTPVQEPAREAQAEQRPEPGAAAAKSSLSDQQVMDILDLGAQFVHNFLSHAIDTLSKTSYEQMRRVALEVEAPVPAHVSPQKRPRGRMHPLMLLVKMGIAATALVQRIFKVTHPHMFPASVERRERVQDAAEKFMGMVKKAMPAAVPGAA